MTTTYEIPSIDELNLDCMHQDELREFAMAVDGKRPIQEARKLFGKHYARGCVRVTMDLRNYAWNKLTAMNLRLKGNIQDACMYEEICERIYKGLPEIAKW